MEESRVPTSPKGFKCRFSSRKRMRIAMEADAHSPWVSRLFENRGHEVLATNASGLMLIYAKERKTDGIDAQKFARLTKFHSKLLASL